MGRYGTPTAPMFLGIGNVDGTGDGLMPLVPVRDLARDYCQRGDSVQYTEYPGADHRAASLPFELEATAFMNARLNGQPVADNCTTLTGG